MHQSTPRCWNVQGTHKERFDADGHGKGIGGHHDLISNNGSTNSGFKPVDKVLGVGSQHLPALFLGTSQACRVLLLAQLKVVTCCISPPTDTRHVNGGVGNGVRSSD